MVVSIVAKLIHTKICAILINTMGPPYSFQGPAREKCNTQENIIIRKNGKYIHNIQTCLGNELL